MDGFPDFKTTVWSMISRARAKSESAMNALLTQYRAPVLDFLCSRGCQPADAEDLTQEVFSRIVQQDLLQKADRAKGRFRWLILGITRNVMREQLKKKTARKRGGGKHILSLEAGPDGAKLEDAISAPQEDEGFDRLWVANLIDRAVAAARDEDRKHGTEYVSLLMKSALGETSYEELAKQHGLKLHDVKNYLHRARKRIADQIVRLVQGYSSTREEYSEELRILSRYLGDKDLLGTQE